MKGHPLKTHMISGLQDKDATVRMRALSSVQALADRLWEADVVARNADGGACAIVQLAPLLADRRGPCYSVVMTNVTHN